jgi:hypothetical protein
MSTVKTPKAKKISVTKALELMKNNKGRFFTSVFTNKAGETRVINGQYLSGQNPSELGYVKVREASKLKAKENSVRNVNLQTLSELKISGVIYKINR